MLTTIFDGRCVICQSTRHLVRRLDWFKRIEFVDIHDGTTARRFPQFEYEALMGAVHVVEAQGKVYAGFDGTRRMMRELPLGFPLWLILHLPFMPYLGRKLYGWVARNRYAVNRWFGVELAPDCADGYCKLPD